MPKFDKILIDGNYWARKFFSVHKQLCAKVDGNLVYTGMAHGFLLGLCNVKESYKGSIIIVWDKGHSRRIKIDQSYKLKRRESKKDWEEKELYLSHLKVLRKLIKLTGVPQASKQGEEGDDILFTLSKTLPGKKLMVTNDHDLYQALTKNTFQLLSKKTGEKIYSARLLERETGLPPTGYSQAMAIAGCSGDGVPGVRGVGLQTAIKMVGGYPDLVPVLLNGGDISPWQPEVDKKNIVVKATRHYGIGDKGPNKKFKNVIESPEVVYLTSQLTKLYEVENIKIKIGIPNISRLEFLLELAEMHECASRIDELGRLNK
jgi:5'-3' exonuclease